MQVAVDQNSRVVEYERVVLAALPAEELGRCSENVRRALDTVLFGTMFLDYMDRALSLVAQRPQEPNLSKWIAQGMDVMAVQTVTTELGFSGDTATCLDNFARIRAHEGIVDDESEIVAASGRGSSVTDILDFDLFRQAHAELSASAADGVIQLTPWIFAMDVYTSQAQVLRADQLFGALDPAVQRVMAELNYSTFNAKTMATGSDVLAGPHADLLEWTEAGVQRAMPHLTLSNMGMGAFLSRILSKTPEGESVHVVNMGAGTGATSAALVMGMEQAAAQQGFDPKTRPVSMVDIEGSESFFDVLCDFAPVATDRLGRSGVQLDPHIHQRLEGPLSVEAQSYHAVHGDILDTLKALDFTEKDGTLVLTANYVWHRLPTVRKKEIIAYVAEHFPESVFIIADLVQNCSAVNRRYFNFLANGLLNCGNVGLKELFEEQGYLVVPIDDFTGLSTLGPLGQRLADGATSDSIFYVAARGPKALERMDRQGVLRARYGQEN